MLTVKDLETACIDVLEFLNSKGRDGADFKDIFSELKKKDSKLISNPEGIGIVYIIHYLMEEKKIRYTGGRYTSYQK